MKVFGFLQNKQDRFVNITCNFILGVIVLVVFSLSIFSPVAVVSNNYNKKVFYSGNTKNNNVSLMVNVYWGTEFLDEMLQIFKDNQVKTTFFVGGCWVAKNNEMLLKILDNGHEVGNHGYNHKDHKKLNSKQNQEEIYSNHELVKAITGVKMNLFAPPSGSFSNNTLEVANSFDYKVIMWSKDTIDWRDQNENLIFSRATNNLKNGDLILMHPTEKTVATLDKIIKQIKKNGFNLTTVTQNLAE